MNIGKQLRELKHEREMGLNREIELKATNKDLQSQQQINLKEIEKLKNEMEDLKEKINGYEFMWENNMRPDDRPKNQSLISLEGRFHKVEDYNNELTDENKNLKLKLKDLTNKTTGRSASTNKNLKKGSN